MLTEVLQVQPVVKWAGGKRQLLSVIRPLLPYHFNTYYEPFVGGGALFCDIQPQKAVINDLNSQLINLYTCIKKYPDDFCKELQKLQDKYNSFHDIKEKDEYYYLIRNDFNKNILNKDISIQNASYFVFLNKVAFNGVYRVNSSGKFNVPSSHKKEVSAYNEENIKNFSILLQNTEILNEDFEKACENVKKEDFVFFDSPYYDTFDTYQSGGFSEDDHRRLFKLFKKLSENGVYCMLTNNDCDYIKDLYKDYKIYEIDVKRMINRDAKNRTGKEIIVVNY